MFERNSLMGKKSILSRELSPMLVSVQCTGAETSRNEWGKVSIKICVEHIFVSIYHEKELNRGIFFLFSFRTFKFVSVIWESLKEILSLEK